MEAASPLRNVGTSYLSNYKVSTVIPTAVIALFAYSSAVVRTHVASRPSAECSRVHDDKEGEEKPLRG